MIRPFQPGKINVLDWNVLDGRIVRFPKRQCIAAIGNSLRPATDTTTRAGLGWMEIG